MSEIPSSGLRIGFHEATRVFAAVLGTDALPIDCLVARLGHADSAEWSAVVLAPRQALCASAGSARDAFTAWKDDAKARFAEAIGDPSLVASAFLDYAAAIASALDRGHGMISSMPEAEISQMLDRIGPLLPADWGTVFSRARQRLGC